MKSIRFLVILALLPGSLFGQALDSIWASQGAFAARITEVNETSVRYQFPHEEFQNSVFKANVAKIKYASGRTEVFTDALGLAPVKSPWDWQKVAVTWNPEQVNGMTSLGFLTGHVSGTKFSSNSRLTAKSYDKLKMETALLGGNVICVQGGFAYLGTSIYSGAAFTSETLDFQAFDHFLNAAGPSFFLTSITRLRNRRRKMTPVENVTQKVAVLSNPKVVNGIITVNAKIEGIPNQEFSVTWFDDEKIILAERDYRSIFSVELRRHSNPLKK